ncbi:hypothetical protein AURDEDRAFT_126396 [Auricularia subglabra TFB-10046 SS5]|nr:hypothetical protein AURDEDRAFT_126396 [Auricularia subglabra TFB-10046 SS5]
MTQEMPSRDVSRSVHNAEATDMGGNNALAQVKSGENQAENFGRDSGLETRAVVALLCGARYATTRNIQDFVADYQVLGAVRDVHRVSQRYECPGPNMPSGVLRKSNASEPKSEIFKGRIVCLQSRHHGWDERAAVIDEYSLVKPRGARECKQFFKLNRRAAACKLQKRRFLKIPEHHTLMTVVGSQAVLDPKAPTGP